MPGSRKSCSVSESSVLIVRTLTANIRERRGDLVDIKVPIYVDKHTVLPDGTSAPESNGHFGE